MIILFAKLLRTMCIERNDVSTPSLSQFDLRLAALEETSCQTKHLLYVRGR